MKKLTKAKKIIIAVVAAVLCIAMVVGIVLWNSVHPLQRFANKIVRKQNFQVEFYLYGIPLFGSVSFTCEVDGNIQHIPASNLVSESYIETVGDKHYTYSKDSSGKWTKTESDAESGDVLSNLQENGMLQQLVDPDNYEAVEGKKNVYRQKDGVKIDNCEDVVITLEKGTCSIEMILYTNGMALEALIVISNIGNINLQLPKVG